MTEETNEIEASDAGADRAEFALLYAVFKEAVYRHECGGIFSTLEKAENAAKDLRDGEPDSHHNYVVVPFYLDEKTEQTPLIEKTYGSERTYFTGGKLVELGVILDVGCKVV